MMATRTRVCSVSVAFTLVVPLNFLVCPIVELTADGHQTARTPASPTEQEADAD